MRTMRTKTAGLSLNSCHTFAIWPIRRTILMIDIVLCCALYNQLVTYLHSSSPNDCLTHCNAFLQSEKKLSAICIEDIYPVEWRLHPHFGVVCSFHLYISLIRRLGITVYRPIPTTHDVYEPKVQIDTISTRLM